VSTSASLYAHTTTRYALQEQQEEQEEQENASS
jgi:hypothetical protein